jgi:FkbM family methyltransferase
MEQARTFSKRFNIIVCPFALYGKTGTESFYEKVDPTADSLVPVELRRPSGELIQNREDSIRIGVATVSASRFIMDNTKPGDEIVLKLDCEGAEYSILDNLLDNPIALARVKKIFIEWHGTPEYKRQPKINQALVKAGISVEGWHF